MIGTSLRKHRLSMKVNLFEQHVQNTISEKEEAFKPKNGDNMMMIGNSLRKHRLRMKVNLFEHHVQNFKGGS